MMILYTIKILYVISFEIIISTSQFELQFIMCFED